MVLYETGSLLIKVTTVFIVQFVWLFQNLMMKVSLYLDYLISTPNIYIVEFMNTKTVKTIFTHLSLQSKEKTIDVLLFKDQLTKRMHEVKDRRLAFERIVDVVKLIGKRGMSFRGEYESAKDLSNPNVSHGNFLDIVLRLAKYDVTLNKHVQSVIKKANMNKTPGRS